MLSTFSIPVQGYKGLALLVRLGPEKVVRLKEMASSQEVSLGLDAAVTAFSEELEFPPRDMADICAMLLALNSVRARHTLGVGEFLSRLDDSVRKHSTEEWRRANEPGWQAVFKHLEPLFAPDNFFSIAGKAQSLWAGGQSYFDDAKILTDIRHVYSEAGTAILLSVLSNTLIIEHFDTTDHSKCRFRVSLDSDDLDALEREIRRARLKNKVARQDAAKSGRTFLVAGEEE